MEAVENQVDQAIGREPLDLQLLRGLAVSRELLVDLQEPSSEEAEQFLHDLGPGLRGRQRIGIGLREQKTPHEGEEAGKHELVEGLTHIGGFLLHEILPFQLVPVQVASFRQEMLPALFGKGRRVSLGALEGTPEGSSDPASAAVQEGSDAIVHRWVNRGEQAGQHADTGPWTKGLGPGRSVPRGARVEAVTPCGRPAPGGFLSDHSRSDPRSRSAAPVRARPAWEQALNVRLEGRDWRPRALLVPILAWFAWSHTADGEFRGIYAGINLAIHEAGHLFLSWFGSSLLMVAGGSLFEVGIPILIALYFWRHGDVAGTLVAVFWVGTALLSIAPYMADARTQALPLVSVGAGTPEHDWYRLLQAAGLLEQDRALARMTRFFGLVVVWCAVAGLIASLARMRRLNERTATDHRDRSPFGSA